MKFIFDSEVLGRAFSIAKIVKPISGDFAMKFRGGDLTIYSSDKRRYACVTVAAKDVEDVDGDYESEEFYITSDRQTMLDSDLPTITLTVDSKTIRVRAEGDGQVRNATLKKRSDTSKRQPIPKFPDINNARAFSSKDFEDLLHQVSCSAQVKETKTEEDMKVNQVHFYPEVSSATSDARFFQSQVELFGLNLDLSIISSDIPLIRTFCAKNPDSDILIFQDNSHLYLSDLEHRSIVCFSRIVSNKPEFEVIKQECPCVIHVDRSKFLKALQWAAMTIEGTQRVSVSTLIDQSVMILKHNGDELSRFPIDLISGDGVNGDYPVKILLGMINHINDDKIVLKYGHYETVLEISGETARPVKSRHFIASMKVRKQ